MEPDKRNPFKTYMILAILEIICLNPICISAGIVALVHSANFNASYKRERAGDFERQRKHARIALLVGLTGVILQFVLIVFLFFTDPSWTNTQEESPEVYYEFLLEGKKISLPTSVDELEKAGVCFTDDLTAYQLNPDHLS